MWAAHWKATAGAHGVGAGSLGHRERGEGAGSRVGKY